jgi:Heterokaryon incompatibility protein (HET)
MRLLKVDDDGELSLMQFVGEEIPEYAILSHTWGADGEEVTFEELVKGTGKHKPGYEKIKLCVKQADLDGLKYSWVDTCCIDKSSSSELSEALNSMFRWYSEAKICYAYLSDVNLATGGGSEELLATSRDDFPKNSRWFTRGWTLQELLAPKLVIFLDSNWRKLGDKTSCCDAISSTTGIDHTILLDSTKIFDELYSTRMFWAARRKTSRPEDIAYCLMGIFGVHMPLLYGEGTGKAFTRLQLELFRGASSQSLLTWGGHPERPIDSEGNQSSIFAFPLTLRPILAQSPSLFIQRRAWHRLHTSNDAKPWVITNRGIEIQVLVITRKDWFVLIGPDSTGVQKRYDLAIAVLPFRASEKSSLYLGMLLSGNSSEGTYNRISSLEGCENVKVPARLALLAEPKKICLSEEPVYYESRSFTTSSKFVIIDTLGFHLHRVLVNGCEWNKSEQCLLLHPGHPQEPQEALLGFANEKHCEFAFYLLISNSIPPGVSQEDWHFRILGITIVQNDYAERLFSNASEMSQHGLRAEEKSITVKMGDFRAVASLENKQIYWDPIYTLKIITMP